MPTKKQIVKETYVYFFVCVYSVFVGRPEEQDDSENSTIYITGLTEKVNLEEMAEFFKHVGPIRVRDALLHSDQTDQQTPGHGTHFFFLSLLAQMNRRLGQPAINIYKDNETGKPKGVATLSYEEPICAKAAVEHFDGMMTHPKKNPVVFHLIFNMKCTSLPLTDIVLLNYQRHTYSCTFYFLQARNSKVKGLRCRWRGVGP